jgi:hypothetical protein
MPRRLLATSIDKTSELGEMDSRPAALGKSIRSPGWPLHNSVYNWPGMSPTSIVDQTSQFTIKRPANMERFPGRSASPAEL